MGRTVAAQAVRLPNRRVVPGRKIYVAGSWEAKDRLGKEALRLEQGGHGDVVSTWLSYEEPGSAGWAIVDRPERHEYRTRDLADLGGLPASILDTLEEDDPGPASGTSSVPSGTSSTPMR